MNKDNTVLFELHNLHNDDSANEFKKREVVLAHLKENEPTIYNIIKTAFEEIIRMEEEIYLFEKCADFYGDNDNWVQPPPDSEPIELDYVAEFREETIGYGGSFARETKAKINKLRETLNETRDQENE